MALFDSIVNEVAQKFGLGDKASTLLSALLSLMTNENTGGLTGFIDRFRQAGLGDLVQSWISTGANQPLTENQLQSALGGNNISNLASKSGISGSVASGALAYMIPKVIDFLTPNGTVPSGIPASVSSFLSGGAPQVTAAAAPASSGLSKLLPLLLLALLAFVGYRYCNRPAETVQTAVLVATPSPTLVPIGSPSLPTALGEFIDKRLPDGINLRIPSMGIENKLIAFIEDTSKPVDRTTWFSFDRLEFETDSARLKPSSEEQLKNIAAILKAYPNVNVKIGGYTDNVGRDDYNLKLSSERAANTKAEIARLGIDEKRMESEGYGKEHPVADNATEEGRARNRRIDIRVTQK